MDLVPTPGQVVSAASNLAHLAAYGGVADLRPMPRTLIDEGTHREVHHYRPSAQVSASGEPVLLVPPLAAPALAFDLRRGCSLVEHLVGQGRPTYVVEYGEVSVQDRTLGIEPWVDDVVPSAVRAVSAHAGDRPVHVVAWSLGGVFALLAAADRADLPLASLSVLGTPLDTTSVPIIAPGRPLLDVRGPEALGLLTRAVRAAGAQQPLVRWALQLSSVQRFVTRPLAIATNLDDAEFLAQVEAVDRFTARTTAYRGRTFGQLYHRFLKGNGLAEGSFELDGRTISLSAVTAPVMVFAGATDTIAPIAAVRAVLPLLTGAREVRFEVVPGGHLGMLTGRGARATTWPALDSWLEEWSTPATPATPSAPAKARGTRATRTRTTAKKTAAKKAAARRTTGRSTPVDPDPGR